MSSSTGARKAYGAMQATNATINIRTVGFVPNKVVVRNLTNNVQAVWVKGMGDAYAEKTVAAGTRTLVTSAGITQLAHSGGYQPGFSLGALADVNDTAGEDLVWEASE